MSDLDDVQPFRRKCSLFLFGGWTHPSIFPLHQTWRLFNELHRSESTFNLAFGQNSKNCTNPTLGMISKKKTGPQFTPQQMQNRRRWLVILQQFMATQLSFLEVFKNNVRRQGNFRARMTSGLLILIVISLIMEVKMLRLKGSSYSIQQALGQTKAFQNQGENYICQFVTSKN